MNNCFVLSIPSAASAESIAREMLYEKLRRRVRFWMRICERVPGTVPILEMTPFIYVAYHVCLGDYTKSSWILYFTVW